MATGSAVVAAQAANLGSAVVAALNGSVPAGGQVEAAVDDYAALGKVNGDSAALGRVLDGKDPLELWRSACMQILIRLRADAPFDPFARSCVGIRDGCLRLFGQAPIHICGAGRLPLQFLLLVQLARGRWDSDAANGHDDQSHCLAARPETVAELSDQFTFGDFDADTNPSSAKARPPRRDIRSGAQRRKRH